MFYPYQIGSIIKFNINYLPHFKSYSWIFDINKTFVDLKKDLEKNNKLKKGMYYFGVEEDIMKDNITLKDYGIIDHVVINVVDNNSTKVKLEITDNNNEIVTFHNYVFVSDFKVIKAVKMKKLKLEIIIFIFISKFFFL